MNLVAKTTIRVFDVPHKKMDGDDPGSSTTGDAILDKARRELEKLAENLELEDAEMRAAMAEESHKLEGEDEGQSELENSTEGWVDEHGLMSDAERDELDRSVLPVRLAILKVCAAFQGYVFFLV